MKKLFVLLVLIYLNQTFIFAQVIEWQNTIGGNSSDLLYSIKKTKEGGYICGGISNSSISGDKTEGALGKEDYWVVKLDSTGNIQWQNTIGGYDYDHLSYISQTIDAGYICGGTSYSGISGDKTEDSLGHYDYWVVKLDSLGNIQWQNTIGGDVSDILESIKQTPDGGYICGGTSSSHISWDKTEHSLNNDYWIIKLDSLGNIQWQNTIGGNDNDQFCSISSTIDGGYILGGSSSSNISGDKTENFIGGSDFWILKLDSLGNIQWQNTIGGNNEDRLSSIIQTNNGGYICGGYSYSCISGDKTDSCFGSNDFWILELDFSGNIQWQNTIGGNKGDMLSSIVLTNDGGYLCGGHSNSSISGNKTENTLGDYDYLVVKLDTIGNIQWQNTIGGIDFDILTYIDPTSIGEYICGGYSQSRISEDKIESCSGWCDFWVIKLTENYNTINGKLFIDINNNQIHDTGEVLVINKTVTELNTSRFSFSEQDGYYNVSVLDSGMFSVYPASINYYNAVPINHTAYFSGINQTDSLNDFAYQPAGMFNDLCVQITPLSRFRPGFNAGYEINYENVGTTTLSPTVIFFPDSAVSFASSTPAASFVSADSIVWNFGPLAPFQKGSIVVTVNVNAATPIGAKINSIVRIEPIVNDANLYCNFAVWQVIATGSFDPNEILVDRDTVYSNELTNPHSLEYIINFQNTGNDTAFTVKVLNPIDTAKLNLGSLEYVASSHPVNITYISWENNLEFRFDNILLADSGVNEPGSHGFVRYRVKPKSSLAVGDSIKNTAYIYFDFNQPIQTNTAVTEIVMPTGINDLKSVANGLQVYPNPSSQNITVQLTTTLSNNSTLVVFDIFGRKVWQTTLDKKQSKVNVDVSGFADGVYFIELHSDNAIARTKFVKQ